MTSLATTSTSLTLHRATAAFENWENNFRANPEVFMTQEETAAMAVATLSEGRGIHFMALLRDLPALELPPAAGEIWPGQGGRFICTIAASAGLPARHLVFGVDEAEELAFGPYESIAGADSHLDGSANTKALIASGKEHPAAAWAAAYTADGHSDFHLPSRHDLLLAYIHAKEHFDTDDWYWSSTQGSRGLAFVQDFEDGNSYWADKDYRHRARACRWIPLTA
ncbi:DUF1566 domain-containing protein [Variovorax boronicumulans]|uniref:DUF1566 domain-containing protein n=1 Tax=Variovorax boronicumulans TaxID=436515 RepID=UPI001C560169